MESLETIKCCNVHVLAYGLWWIVPNLTIQQKDLAVLMYQFNKQRFFVEYL